MTAEINSKRVISFRRNTVIWHMTYDITYDADVMSSGRLSHSFGPAAEANDRSPTATRRNGRTVSWLEADGRTTPRRHVSNAAQPIRQVSRRSGTAVSSAWVPWRLKSSVNSRPNYRWEMILETVQKVKVMSRVCSYSCDAIASAIIVWSST